MAFGRALTREGNHTEAREQLEWALELYGIDSMAVHRAHVLVLLASMHHGRRDLAAARGALPRAEELVKQLADPGVLPALLEQTTRMLGAAAARHQGDPAPPLTERELVVMRLLATRKSTPEISRELHVSVNTVRTQVRAIYHKLDASSRAEAVTRAHRLGRLPVKFT
jgi:DNA-binding NarL/FixJ family response regulator